MVRLVFKDAKSALAGRCPERQVGAGAGPTLDILLGIGGPLPEVKAYLVAFPLEANEPRRGAWIRF
jgi:hypothetical protein